MRSFTCPNGHRFFVSTLLKSVWCFRCKKSYPVLPEAA